MLKLSLPLQNLFGKIKPMEPVKAEKPPFTNPEYTFQIKWDGVRIIAFITSEGVRLQNRRGRERTLQYPEFGIVKEVSGMEEAIIDGEAVVLEKGRPSFSRIIERDFSVREDRIKRLSQNYPCTFCVFDILFLKGEDLTQLPLHQRQDILQEVLKGDNEGIYLNNNFSDGNLLYRQVCEKELEGIVAKDKNSSYLIGRKSSYWLKIKPRRKILAVVGGITFKNGGVSALLMGAYHDNQFFYIGRAGSGLSFADGRNLKEAAGSLSTPKPFFVNPPGLKDVCWFKPALTAQIEFMEWTQEMSMRAPVIKGFSSSPPEEAIF